MTDKANQDFDDYDWSHDPLDSVIRGALAGISTAIEEYKVRQKKLDLPPLDTISSKA